MKDRWEGMKGRIRLRIDDSEGKERKNKELKNKDGGCKEE